MPGNVPDLDPSKIYDVAVVGAGLPGLRPLSMPLQGLTVLVLDQRAFGGQAGASARIENYLGFPTGISGQALAGRAFNQAQKFGAELAIPLEATQMDCGASDQRGPQPLLLALSNGEKVQARTIVIASGAAYRRPDIPGLANLEGAGVSYWASPVEAKLCEGEEVALVGGGEFCRAGGGLPGSKGQAPASDRARKGLEASMSRYLIERIAALPNVEIHTGTEVSALVGDRIQGLTEVGFRNRATGAVHTCPVRHLFLFVGADPNTAWLVGCVKVDAHGFVVTGGAEPDADSDSNRSILPLQTNRSGVFAIGDVRAGSTKRVAAAVGEGAAVVAQIHSYLATAS